MRSGLFESIGIDPGIIILILLALTVVLLLNVLGNNAKIGRLQRKYKMFMKGMEGQSLEKAFEKKFNQVDRLLEMSNDHNEEILRVKKRFEHMYNKYGIEKYDAFEDVGGKLSFALALLDESNSGIILNAVHSRDNCYLYLKEIVKGESYVMLSQEEVEALRKAVNDEINGVELLGETLKVKSEE